MIIIINNDYEFQSIKNAINYFKINSESDIFIKDAYFLRTSDNLPEKEVSLSDSQIKELGYRINSVISFCNGESQADIAEEASKDYLRNNLI